MNPLSKRDANRLRWVLAGCLTLGGCASPGANFASMMSGVGSVAPASAGPSDSSALSQPAPPLVRSEADDLREAGVTTDVDAPKAIAAIPPAPIGSADREIVRTSHQEFIVSPAPVPPVVVTAPSRPVVEPVASSPSIRPPGSEPTALGNFGPMPMPSFSGNSTTIGSVQTGSQPGPLAESTSVIVNNALAGSMPGTTTTTETTVVSMTLFDLEQVALANNPTIRELSAQATQSASLQQQVGRYANPTAGYFGSQLADNGTDQHGAFVEQEFVRGGKLALNQEVLAQSTQVQLWKVESQRVRVLTDVRMRFYEALAAQRQVQLTEEFQQLLRRGVKVAEDRKRAGEGTSVDILQTEIQLREIGLARQRAELRFRGAWQDLVATAGMPTLAPVPLVAELRTGTGDLDWAGTYGSLLGRSPELAAARSQVREAQAYLRRQQVQAVPNVTAQLGAGYDNGTNTGLINLQVGAPLPVFNQNSGNISAAYADYCRATFEVQRIEMGIKSRLARTSQDYDSALVSVRTYENEILPKAQETLDLSEQAYGAGELNFNQILLVRRTYFESNLTYVQALGDLAQAKAHVDGFLLTGGLDAPDAFQGDDSLRGQTFSQQ